MSCGEKLHYICRSLEEKYYSVSEDSMNSIRKALAYGIFMVFMSSTQAWSHSSSLQSYTLDGRTFFPFNLLTGNNRFNKNARITAIESNIRRLTSANSIQSTKISTLETVQATHTGQIAALTALQTAQGTQISNFQQSLTTANARITALEASDVTSNARIATLEAAETECPATATNAIKVGAKCYTVNTVATTFAVAQTSCGTQGGILAEPLISSQAIFKVFVDKLTTAFGTTFTSLTEPFIGILETATPDTFQYDSSKGTIGTITIPATASIAATEAVVINVPSGNAVNTVDETLPRPYICEFDVI